MFKINWITYVVKSIAIPNRMWSQTDYDNVLNDKDERLGKRWDIR